MKIMVFLFTALVVAVMAVQAQTSIAQPSVSVMAPNLSSWTVTFVYSDGKQNEDQKAKYDAAMARLQAENPTLAKALANTGGGIEPRTKELTIVKTGDIKHEIVAFTSGSVFETWCTPTARVSRNPGSGKIEYKAASGSMEDFPELKWITSKNFKENRKVGDIDCFVFSGKVNRMEIENPLLLELMEGSKTPDVEVEVVIAADTRLPISIKMEEVTRNYVFSTTPPTEMQSFPEDFASVMRSAEAKLRARLAPFSPP